MTLEDIRDFSLSLKGTTESIKWTEHLCFSVGDKMYMILSPDQVPVNASFKTTNEKFEELITREGIIPAPYLARNKWVQVDDIGRLKKKEWQELITNSYRLVFEKLPVKTRNQITASKPSRRK